LHAPPRDVFRISEAFAIICFAFALVAAYFSYTQRLNRRPTNGFSSSRKPLLSDSLAARDSSSEIKPSFASELHQQMEEFIDAPPISSKVLTTAAQPPAVPPRALNQPTPSAIVSIAAEAVSTASLLSHATAALKSGSYTAGEWSLSLPTSVPVPTTRSGEAAMSEGDSADAPPDPAMVAKCKRLLSMGVPAGAILAKLRAEGALLGLAERALASAGGCDAASKPAMIAEKQMMLTALGLEPGLAATLESLFKPRQLGILEKEAPENALVAAVVKGPVTVLDARRAMQIGIGIARFRGVTRETMRSALLSLSPRGLAPMQCVLLQSLAPSASEAAAVSAAAQGCGSRRLGDAETFLLELSHVPRAQERAEALAFRVTAPARLTGIAQRVSALRAAADALSADVCLQRIATVASSLLARSANGTTTAASSFSLLSLHALKGTRIPQVPFREARGTLMHLLAAVLERTDLAAAGYEAPRAVIDAAGEDLAGLDAELRDGVMQGGRQYRACLAFVGHLSESTPAPSEGTDYARDDDGLAPADIFAKAHETAAAQVGAALKEASDAWLHVWNTFSLAPISPPPAPELVFNSIMKFSAELARCRAEMTAHGISYESRAGKSARASA
jgi:hypothetical protein